LAIYILTHHPYGGALELMYRWYSSCISIVYAVYIEYIPLVKANFSPASEADQTASTRDKEPLGLTRKREGRHVGVEDHHRPACS